MCGSFRGGAAGGRARTSMDPFMRGFFEITFRRPPHGSWFQAARQRTRGGERLFLAHCAWSHRRPGFGLAPPVFYKRSEPLKLENLPQELKSERRWAFAAPGLHLFFIDPSRPTEPITTADRLLSWTDIHEHLPVALHHNWGVAIALRPEDGIVVVKISGGCRDGVASLTASAVMQKYFGDCYREAVGGNLNIFTRCAELPEESIRNVSFVNNAFVEVSGHRLRGCETIGTGDLDGFVDLLRGDDDSQFVSAREAKQLWKRIDLEDVNTRCIAGSALRSVSTELWTEWNGPRSEWQQFSDDLRAG